MTANNKNIDKQGKKLLNVPNLRFPEFEGEWTTKRLEDCVLFLDDQRKPVKSSDRQNVPGIYPYYGASGIIDYVDNYLFDDDLILLSEDGANILDRNYRVSFISRGKVWINNHAHVLKPKPLYSIDYLSEYLESLDYNIYNTGTTMPKLNQEVCRGIKIYVPSESEQKKIGRFLNLVNERISTQNRIIEKYESLIKGLCNELMDNSKWAKVYVGDFMEFFSTNSLSWEQLSYDNGQVRNLHYGLIHSGLPTIVDCLQIPLPYIQDGYLPKQYTICKGGDIAFADASEDTVEVGKAIEITNVGKNNIICGLHTIHGRDVKDMTIEGFKGFAFNTKYFHNQLRRVAQGSKVFSINAGNIRSCYLYIPPIFMQHKIVGLLTALQVKIQVAKQERHAYYLQKQYLLKELFI